ncbi:neuroguidin-like [Anneissia japonica]|uniref:neuroguidin-like n=1 Tax=Anneissia japonica TaxID=1529436 RepID=UPI0014258F63|nr:neuroguidin-like [Anneissia japonica]XP_033117204.1 neuroguidin-like [Anneissia japonica]
MEEEDVHQTIALFSNISSQVSGVKSQVEMLLNKVKNGDISTTKGVSFLEVKYHLLLSYIMNLGLVMMKKCEGQQINGIPAIQRLVEIRTVLEKMRPIDYKLQYQVDKLIKTALTGTVAQNDPTRFKPNPDNLISKLEDEEEDSDSEVDVGKPKKYVPPRVAAMHYVDDESAAERRQRLLERAKKKALSSSIIQDLRAEYSDGPEEIRENVNFYKQKQERAAKERNQYEEEYFKRLPVTKKEKHAQKRMATMSSLDGITKFGDISALSHDIDDVDNFQSKKKKKMPSRLRRILSKKRGKRKKF